MDEARGEIIRQLKLDIGVILTKVDANGGLLSADHVLWTCG